MAKLNADVPPSAVAAAIAKSASYTAPGADGIPYELLKCLPAPAMHALARIYTSVLRTHKAPSAWKHGVVTMLYKKGDTEDCSNYRGITLLPTIGKVFEHILLTRLTRYAEKHGLLHNNQNAFRKNRSTDEHFFALMQAIHSNPSSIAVFVDIRKAYPTVFREGLFTKLA